jgi:branched-subunit amino acid transport protein
MNKKLKHRKGAWFVKVRGSYLPCSWQGWLSYVPYVGYLVAAMVILIHTLGTDHWPIIAVLYLPAAVAAVAVMSWLASQKS